TSRHSSTNRSSSGSIVTTSAPSAGPTQEPEPPMTTIIRPRTTSGNPLSSGPSTPKINGVSAPAKAPSTPLSTAIATRNLPVSTPSERASGSSVRSTSTNRPPARDWTMATTTVATAANAPTMSGLASRGMPYNPSAPDRKGGGEGKGQRRRA